MILKLKSLGLKILFQMPLVLLIINFICFAKALMLTLLISQNCKSFPALRKLLTSNRYLSINPVLWSFFRGKIALVETGIGALLDLITHKSARLCSQADLFDHICEREGQNKILFLYQQHRFTKCSSFYSWS